MVNTGLTSLKISSLAIDPSLPKTVFAGTDGSGVFVSVDGGETWSEAELVTEEPVVWSRLLGVNEYIAHRLWAVENNEQLVVWHDVSQDGGLTW